MDYPLQLALVSITDAPCLVYENPLDGSSKKKQAEHQAAKIAVQNLSGIINCRSLANAGDNWIGFLKERVDALGLKQPEYDFSRKKVCISQEIEGPTTIEDSSHSEFEFIAVMSRIVTLQ